MANFSTNIQLFIPFNSQAEAFTPSNSENTSHLKNINNVTPFENNRVKRRKRDVQCDDDTHKQVPWKRRDLYSKGVIGLHEEIDDFYECMRPTTQEQDIRLKVIEHIKQTVISLWPHAEVDVFGSFKTGLYLPSSDIDIVVSGKWDRLPLHTLKAALVKSGIDDSDISVISNTTVPIVRLTHSATKVKIDISFNVPNGLKSADLIKVYIKKYPCLPKVLLVLKQFLLHRNLNEVYYGGMSSYALTLLLISFLQGHHKPKFLPVSNLGILVMEFLELYGINFNYEKVSISITNGGCYFPKTNPWGSYLSIIDPLCDENDIAKGTFLMREIKYSFENAYNILHRVITDSKQASTSSMLQMIFDVDANVIAQRMWIKNNFDGILKSFPICPKSDFKEKDWKENVEASVSFSCSVSKKDSNGGESSKQPMDAIKRPFQKTLVFYGSKQSANNSDFDGNHMQQSRHFTDKKHFRQGRQSHKNGMN